MGTKRISLIVSIVTVIFLLGHSLKLLFAFPSLSGSSLRVSATDRTAGTGSIQWAFRPLLVLGGLFLASSFRRRNHQPKPLDQEPHKTVIKGPTTVGVLDKLQQDYELIKRLSITELEALSAEIRSSLLASVSQTGGHLGSNLGAVELTVALHHVFDFPKDKLVFDVGHQCYPHKLLTGRKDRFLTLRQGGGLSGFTNREESKFDPFGAGHASTAVSAAVGMAIGRDLKTEDFFAIPVVGDGALTGGMVYEAMNHAGWMKLDKFLMVLNDNEQVSLPTAYNAVDQPVGALAETLKRYQADTQAETLSKLLTSPAFQQARSEVKKTVHKTFTKEFANSLGKMEEFTRGMLTSYPRGTMFEELGFFYVGPVDGHNMHTLVEVLRNLKESYDRGFLKKPVLLHVKTLKGKGYAFAEAAKDKLHGVTPFDVSTGKPPVKEVKCQTTECQTQTGVVTDEGSKPKGQSFTDIFAETLTEIAETDPAVVAITAAMPGGTGLAKFQKQHPSRFFDVGICEPHAVTAAAGMATEGVKPFVAIYSTFMQRAYDSIIHDAALQKLPVRLVMDRAGFVGNDGATHQGAYDTAYLRCVPNLKLCAPADAQDLKRMLRLMADVNDGPIAIRFPRGTAVAAIPCVQDSEVELGKGRVVAELTGPGTKSVALVSYGARLVETLNAAEMLKQEFARVTVVDARWCKPLDEALLLQLAGSHDSIVTVEEGSCGGFGSAVMEFLAHQAPAANKVLPIYAPDKFFEHDSAEAQIAQAGLSADKIALRVKTVLINN